MNSEILIALIGLFSTALSYVVSWFTAKRKYNVEIDTNEIKNLRESLEFYRKIVADYTEKLQFYIDLSEKTTVEVYRLKGIIHKLANKVCINTSCLTRETYSEEEIKNIFEEINLTSINGDKFREEV